MSTPRHALYLSHGGGPLPLLGDPAHADMVQCLEDLAASIDRPSAMLVVSAHWEESGPTLTSGATPPLIFDYSGFPEAAYAVTYPCPGNPPLARAVAARLADAGLDARLDGARGFDHGLFVPLKLMYPEADIPCIQLSLSKDLDPELHLELGRALQGLDDPSLLVIGSGFSFHNLRELRSAPTPASKAANEAFEAWLVETCGSSELGEGERRARLIDWESAPSARDCHPREEHLLPLHVCYGYAGSACSRSFELTIMNKQASMYLW
ncbi:MAG: class III extradiol ring-cleavage dioxygenase [Planctomycetota bacterium]|nr:class III extradiol ring-cleavage dioxygenase [Planctomycetota bacterium]